MSMRREYSFATFDFQRTFALKTDCIGFSRKLDDILRTSALLDSKNEQSVSILELY